MATRRKLDDALEYGRSMQPIHELQSAGAGAAPEDIVAILDVSEVDADAQPKKITLQELVAAAGGGGGAESLGDLTDVDLTTTPPTDGEALVYDSATGDWIPGAAGAAAAGSANQIQYNDGLSPAGLAASADLTWDDTGKVLGVGGDVDLDDGGTYTTTLQTITATANRTISFPDATGTVGLVAGSSGQLLYNSAGANAGTPTLTYDGSILTSSGRFVNSYNATASSPAKAFTGTWFTGGTATTTKPQVLIEPTGTTSTAWSTSGTGLGVNAASGFAGNLLDLQINGVSSLKVSGTSATTTLAYGSSNIQLSSALNVDLLAPTIRMHAGNSAAGVFYSITGITLARDTSYKIQAIDSANGGAINGADLTLAGQNRTSTSSTLANGGNVRLYGGDAPTGNPNPFNGGSVFLDGGTGNTGGANGNIVIGSVRGLAQIASNSTVAGLPATPAVGMLTRVTDATAPAVGSTVAGGGAAAALVWWNGSNWTVIGV